MHQASQALRDRLVTKCKMSDSVACNVNFNLGEYMGILLTEYITECQVRN